MKDSDVLDHATSEIAIGSKLGVDATKKIPGEGFKRPETSQFLILILLKNPRF